MLSAVDIAGLLTFEQAASKLGWTGRGRSRRLKRACFSRERRSGSAIVTRLGTEKKPDYRVTLGALRHAFPELFPSKVDSMQSSVRHYLSTIDSHIREKTAAYVTEHVEPRLEELWERDEVIAAQVEALGQRVASMAKQIKR